MTIKQMVVYGIITPQNIHKLLPPDPTLEDRVHLRLTAIINDVVRTSQNGRFSVSINKPNYKPERDLLKLRIKEVFVGGFRLRSWSYHWELNWN
jgi:hypothetical protein